MRCITGLLCFAFASVATASDEAALKLPPHDFGCVICHDGSGASATAVPASTASDLNTFGDEWLSLASNEADRLWSAMAGGNADDDGCSNGCELDDPRGTYLPDLPFDPETCAPGDPRASDCALPINEQSWSTLKTLFGDQ